MTDVTVPTDRGPGRLVVSAADGAARAVVVLGHGAGGGVDAFDLVALADGLTPAGFVVARYSQPWREAGRRVAGHPASLDAGWAAAMAVVGERWHALPVVVGGRSAGARVACRWAADHPVTGVLALSFPLHPPGSPGKSRIGELVAAAAPTLVVQGSADPFGTPDEVRQALAVTPQAGERTVAVVEGATHELGPRRKADDPQARAAAITGPVLGWLEQLLPA